MSKISAALITVLTLLALVFGVHETPDKTTTPNTVAPTPIIHVTVIKPPYRTPIPRLYTPIVMR